MKTENDNIGNPNLYLMALLTAALAGLFSIIGGYFVAGFQARYAVEQKQLEYRIEAYESFLKDADRQQSPGISELLNVGKLATLVATNGEIQKFEDGVAELLQEYDTQEWYWQLNSEFNLLRLHGSEQVARVCDDILKAVALRHSEINWDDYSAEVSEYYLKWEQWQEQGVAYGWEERNTEDERLMIVIVSRLMEVLIQQLRSEIRDGAT